MNQHGFLAACNGMLGVATRQAEQLPTTRRKSRGFAARLFRFR